MVGRRLGSRDRMTFVERMTALQGGEQLDRVPFFSFALGFCAKNIGYPVACIYNDADRSFKAQLWTREQYGFDSTPFYGYASYGGWEFGGKIKFPEGKYEQAPSHASFPVQSEKDAWNLKLPDIKTAGCIPVAMEFSKLQDKFGLPISVVVGGSFTIAGNICPVETLCRWILRKSEMAHHILRLATDYIIKIIKYWVNVFGAERVVPNIWEPLSTNDIISPRHFEEFVLPYLMDASERALEAGVKYIFYHICGEQNLNLPYWSSVPMGDPGMVSLGHQVDLLTAMKYFGDKCIIAGNIDPQIILEGPPQKLYEICRQCIEKAKHAPKGYILMPGCEIPVMTPPYHLYVMRKAINGYGWYD